MFYLRRFSYLTYVIGFKLVEHLGTYRLVAKIVLSPTHIEYWNGKETLLCNNISLSHVVFYTFKKFCFGDITKFSAQSFGFHTDDSPYYICTCLQICDEHKQQCTRCMLRTLCMHLMHDSTITSQLMKRSPFVG